MERIRSGGINPSARPRIVADLGALVIIDADHGMGMSTGVYSADMVVERANEHGVGLAIVRNGNHFGPAAFYSNRIADAGLFGLATCNTDKVMCAPFGGKRVLGTNPVAMSAPLPYHRRPNLDMATSNVAHGRLLVAVEDDVAIPDDWAVDANGQATTSASAALDGGALLPAGGAKGFGLAFMIDALVAVAGAELSPDVAPLYGDPSAPQRLGQAFMAVQANACRSLAAYQESVNRLVDAVHQSSPGSGPRALAPGEPELAREQSANGYVEVADGLLEKLEELAAEASTPLPKHAG